MYLISVYFDQTTEKRIMSYMKQIANATCNTAMLDGNVSPHITVAAFDTERESVAYDIFNSVARNLKAGKIQWVSVGTFLPGVLYITPVLNQYLQEMSEKFQTEITCRSEVSINHKYRTFSWLPHTTLAKHLSKEEMVTAFKVMQNQFGLFEGEVVKVGLAKTNPYEDLEVRELKG